MDIYNSFSSHAMTKLLAWRNPQGQEENWMRGQQRIENLWAHAGKVVTAEIGICLLTATALIESVAYFTLALAMLPIACVTFNLYNFFAIRLSSSNFTVIWGIANAIIYNPRDINVVTRESYARSWGQRISRIHLMRLRDVLEMRELERNPEDS